MTHWLIRFDEKQPKSMLSMFDETMIEHIHIMIGSTQDYTLCGHATHEYSIHKVTGRIKPTCPNCIRVVKECKEVCDAFPFIAMVV